MTIKPHGPFTRDDHQLAGWFAGWLNARAIQLRAQGKAHRQAADSMQVTSEAARRLQGKIEHVLMTRELP